RIPFMTLRRKVVVACELWPSARLARQELVGLERFSIRGQFLGSSRIVRLIQNERKNIRGLLSAQRARVVLRHGSSDAVEQISKRLVIPLCRECVIDQPGSHF